MSSFLISELKNLSKDNLNFILDVTDEKLLNDLIMYIFSRGNKESVLFLIKNDKIPESLSVNLFKYITNNGFYEMFYDLDYTKFNIHVDTEYILRWASSVGKVNLVKFLIEKGVDIHACNDYALRFAARNNNLEVVKLLIEKGANIHADNDFAFKWACENKNIEVIKYLIEKGANIQHFGVDALVFSCQYENHIGVTKLLIENGVDIHGKNDAALRMAGQYGNLKTIKVLINTDLDYFSKNEYAIEIIKKFNLFDFYGIIASENDGKIQQTKEYIVNYIKSNDLESLKKCDQYDFSEDEYHCFFKSLLSNNIEIIELIFEKIKDKEELRNTYNKFSSFFSDESKSNFEQLFKNIKLAEIKQQIEKLYEEIKKLKSQ